jgi:hypothetical protein
MQEQLDADAEALRAQNYPDRKATAACALAEDRTIKKKRKKRAGTTRQAIPGGRVAVFLITPKYPNRA